MNKNIKLNKIKIKKYIKVGLKIMVVIGTTMVIPSIVHASGTVDTSNLLYNYMYNNDIGKCRTIDQGITHLFNYVPGLNESCDAVQNELLKISAIPENAIIKTFHEITKLF